MNAIIYLQLESSTRYGNQSRRNTRELPVVIHI